MLEKIGRNIGKIFLGLVAILLFFLGYQCGNKDNSQSAVTKVVTNYRDTIFPKDTILTFKDKLIPYPVYIHDTTLLSLPTDSLDLYRFFVYNDSIEDSNIKIYSNILTQGRTLRKFKPSYKLKVPLIIRDSTVVKIDSFIYQEYKYKIYVGIIASPKMLAPTLDFSINRSTYSIGYDPFNKQPIIGFKYKLISWSPKKKK